MNNLKYKRGITLIALVITVIVLLILAGVAVSIGTNGDNLFSKANEAKTEWNEKVAEESTVKSVWQQLYEYTDEVDWKTAMKEAEAPASQDEARNSGVIGIGTDGKPVDMDLWEYTLLEDGTYGLNDATALVGGSNGRSAGYLGTYTNDGQIIGKVPTYISTDSGETYKAVTSMTHTFYNCEELVIAPKIPITVKDLNVTFYQSHNLVTPPAQISDSVKTMRYTFSNCTSLETSPILGNNIEDMTSTFSGSGIKIFDKKIPDSVTLMSGIFNKCMQLETFDSALPNNVTDMRFAFYLCTKLTKGPNIITNHVTNMQAAFYGCIELQNAPTIVPNSVTNMFQAFSECKKMTGKMTINANLTGAIVYSYDGNDFRDYDQCFYKGAASIGDGIVIAKESECTELENNFNRIVSENTSNITFEH